MADDLVDRKLEYNVLAQCFRSPGAIQYFVDNLPDEYMGKLIGMTGLNQLYVALMDYHQIVQGETVDSVGFKIWAEAERPDITLAAGGVYGLDSLITDSLATVELMEPGVVVNLLKKRGDALRQQQHIGEIQQLLTKKEHITDEDRKKLEELYQKVRDLQDSVGYDPYAEVITAKDILEHTESLWDLPDFLPTPFPSLNKAIGYDEDKGGFIKGAVHAVAAPSGHGKSTFCKVLMNHWVDQGETVLFINYEEPGRLWETVLFTQVTKQNVYKAANYSPAERNKYNRIFMDKMEEWGSRFMVRHDPETSYFEDLERWLRDLIGRHDQVPDVVIIDTIQSMFMKGKGSGPRWGQYEEMMVRLEKLAKDLNCVLIITAQENTNRMKEKRETVQQSDMGGSITIVQKSTLAIHLTKVGKVEGLDLDDGRVELSISKNRITGTAYSNDPPMIKYIDDIKSFVPYEPVLEEDYSMPDNLENINDALFTFNKPPVA